MPPNLSIGLIGYGGIGRVHAIAYRSLPFHYGLPANTIRIAAVATAHEDSAQEAAAEVGCDIWNTHYQDLLDREDIQVVDICVPNDRHEEIVLAAAAAGKHVYCEKPLAIDLDQARRMLGAVQAAGVKHQITFNFRFIPAVLRARELMEDGFVGRVFSFRGRYHRASYIDPAKPLSWRLQRDRAGGGALYDLGSHLLDLVRYLLGDIGQVRATLETLIPQRPVAAGATTLGTVDVDDLALLELRTRAGARGVLDISRMGTGATNNLDLEIFGDRGALRIDLAEPNWLHVYDNRDPSGPLGGDRGFKRIETVQHYPGQQAPDWTMATSFVRSHAECQYRFLTSIWEDTPAAPDLADGLQVQAIMQAAQVSAQDRRWVDLSQLEEARSSP